MSSPKAPKMGTKKRARAKAEPKAKSKPKLPPLPADTPRVLHLHSTFAAGGKELRAVQLINAFGRKLRHSIISAEPGQHGAHDHISGIVKVDYPRKFPSLKGLPSPRRLAKLAKAMMPYDLVLTYNWGAMDAVMAHTVFADSMDLPPLIHHEDGFNEDEATELKTRRNWYRKVALARASGLVVPSKRLEEIAIKIWQQPRGRVMRIPNGIDTKAFAKHPNPNAIRVMKRKDEHWVGTLAGLRPVKQLDQLVRTFATLPENWQLVLVGEGPERDTIALAAEELSITHRVHMPGAVSDPSKVIGLFDIFALSSASEQFPLSVVEAMAAGLPILAPDVGDIRDMVAEINRDYIAQAGDMPDLGQKLGLLSRDEDLRKALGEANKARAGELYDSSAMVENYRALYSSAMGRDF